MVVMARVHFDTWGGRNSWTKVYRDWIDWKVYLCRRRVDRSDQTYWWPIAFLYLERSLDQRRGFVSLDRRLFYDEARYRSGQSYQCFMLAASEAR